VPDWLHTHLNPDELRAVALAQIRTEREILEVRAKAAAQLEKLLKR
jgi:hypothetical protein